jgi:hypothetical protein
MSSIFAVLRGSRQVTQVRQSDAVVEGLESTYRIDLPGQVRAATLVRRMDQMVAGSSIDAASRSSRTVASIEDCGATLVCDQRFVAHRGRLRTVSCVVSAYCADQLVRQGGVREIGPWPTGRRTALGRSLLGVMHGFAIADEFDLNCPSRIAGPRIDLAQRSPSVVSVCTPTRRFIAGAVRDVVSIEMRRSETLGGFSRVRSRRPYAVLYVDRAAVLHGVGPRVVAASFSISGVDAGAKGYLELDNCV